MIYDPQDDARKSYAVAIDAMRERLEGCERPPEPKQEAML